MPTMLAYEKLCDSLKQHIIAIGLDSSELPYPPKLFTKVFCFECVCVCVCVCVYVLYVCYMHWWLDGGE